ncbi:DUF2971 domain-containing protein [Thorsellia anophelis]|uniref:DUF2971 domain-containing protein n=1 Tax=Thorsellia anophelis DSM 18579 TaxID=1123402 RepID=A0A1I0D6R5_9GAMM|nr:DUF2971 domain-containing protein [Thorsellia anophelis]SET27736.1 Protein of unknown function [Thorsellia anophelis DSM 18579]
MNGWGIYCVSLTNKSLSLWDRYTDNYRGICIEYDPEAFELSLQEEKLFYHRKISYIESGEKRIESENLVDSSFADYFISNYFMKTADWLYEDEYRFVFEKEGLVKYGHSAIKKIYFGCYTPEIYIKYVIEKFQENQSLRHVTFERMGLDFDTQEIKFTPI